MTLVMGIQHLRDGIEPQAVLGADMSVIGIVGTAENADADTFPLNTAVEVYTNNTALRTDLGDVGTLPNALIGLSAMLVGVGAARTVIVRVAEGEDNAETISNLVGSEGAASGVWALLDAPEDLGVTPRLLLVPGYTSQTETGVTALAIGTPGTGYEEGDTISGTGGNGTGFSGVVTSVGDNGEITGVSVVSNGSSYLSAPTLSVTSDAGEDAVITATVEQLANPVCTIMPTICERLKAHFIPEGPSNSRQAALNWRETLPVSQRFLHPLRQDAKVYDGGELITQPLSPYVAGAYISRDAGTGGVPTRSAANAPLYGLVGVTPNIPLSIIDANSLGQSDLEASFGIVVRGNIGVDGALTDGGFIFWGTDTLSSESEWLFANVSRMRDYLELLQVKALRTYLGKFNLTYATVQAIINTIESQLVRLKADQYILDYRLGIDNAANTPEELRLGHLDLQFRAEEPPVLRKITLRSRRHREALTNLVRSIAVALGSEIAA